MDNFLARFKSKPLTHRLFQIHPMLITTVVTGLICLLLSIGIVSYYQQRFLPGIKIDQLPVGNLTLAQAQTQLQTINRTLPPDIVLIAGTEKVASSAAQLDAKYDLELSLQQAWQLGHTGMWYHRIWTIFQTLLSPPQFTTQLSYSAEKLTELINLLKNKVDIAGFEPYAQLGVSGAASSITINPGKVGQQLELEPTLTTIINSINQNNSPIITIEAIISPTAYELTPDQITQAQQRATKLVGKNIMLESDSQKILLTDQELVSLLSFPQGISTLRQQILINKWQEQVTKSPQDAIFNYDPTTLKVNQFVPPQDGQTLDIPKTQQQLNTIITELENLGNELPLLPGQAPLLNQSQHNKTGFFVIPLALMTTPPEVTLAKTNNLGIQTKIGFGDSFYYHSIPSRVHNVNLTAQRINLTIVKPGEEFSFNQTLGEVSGKTGYQPAYVIQSGRTVLGDGGGVCQVSTTLFRALLNAGVKITLRRPHSYRVSYYEFNTNPGFDATVYAGDVDLRFINDTDHHLLIYTENDPQALYLKVELYGTWDGRTTEIKDYKMWGYEPPAATQYIPDPSLPAGRLKQIDWSASGIKSSYTNVIKDKNGQVIREDKYYSYYRPWSAKYLQGTR